MTSAQAEAELSQRDAERASVVATMADLEQRVHGLQSLLRESGQAGGREGRSKAREVLQTIDMNASASLQVCGAAWPAPPVPSACGCVHNLRPGNTSCRSRGWRCCCQGVWVRTWTQRGCDHGGRRA